MSIHRRVPKSATAAKQWLNQSITSQPKKSPKSEKQFHSIIIMFFFLLCLKTSEIETLEYVTVVYMKMEMGRESMETISLRFESTNVKRIARPLIRNSCECLQLR